ncbi:hypothetical protein [Granulibacter bethesdensis]|uniref:hypothetical protein n=1 Tax=Granulibacter bethesdensis TaxID=364410 RepID=UPI0003F20A87|nr:hypothetical protein [Granulibacter bethesdensis]AHJ66367.1 hypothetical protein GbCGDNIH4_7169 [Granulibacter bethesdensis CGDNIH4]AHJ69339.1 hypothetical protein GbCGDNIH2_7288 [Granulibacter bethesdensis]
MTMAAAVTTDIAREGRLVEIRRGTASVSVPAVIRTYRPQEIVGALRQGDREVRIAAQALAAAGWSTAPRCDDRMIVDGVVANVQFCDTRFIGGVSALHILTIRV